MNPTIQKISEDVACHAVERLRRAIYKNRALARRVVASGPVADIEAYRALVDAITTAVETYLIASVAAGIAERAEVTQ